MTTFNRIWKTKRWQHDYTGRRITSGLQAAYQMAAGTVLSSRSYLDANDMTGTEFNTWTASGKLTTTMFVEGGGHGGAFGYDESNRIIYTLVEHPVTRQKYVGAVTYQPNQVVGVDDFQWLAKVPRYVRFATDSVSDGFVASDALGNVYSGRLSDLKQKAVLPAPAFNLGVFGFKINPTDHPNSGQLNTLQSNGVCGPYAFFTFGNANNTDPRLIVAIDLRDQTLVVSHEITPQHDIQLKLSLEKGGHMEPEGVYYDRRTSRLIVGINRTEGWGIGRFGYWRTHSELYATTFFNAKLPDISQQ